MLRFTIDGNEGVELENEDVASTNREKNRFEGTFFRFKMFPSIVSFLSVSIIEVFRK